MSKNMKNINLEWIENKLGDAIKLRDMNFVTGDLIVIEESNPSPSPTLKPYYYYYYVVSRTKFDATLFSITGLYIEFFTLDKYLVFKGERWAVLSRIEPSVTNQ